MKKKITILKWGEVTGHSHKILTDVDFNEKEKKLDTFKETPLEHEEHDTITLPKKKGLNVGDVVEYDPIEENIRNVAD
jgi:hypothetical protein